MADVVDLYLRKSKGITVERQLADLTAGSADHGLVIGRTFADPDRSASRYRRREREDFAQLVAHIEAGDCRIIGIAEASRGSRDLTEWSTFLDLCRARDVRIFVSSHDRIYDLKRRRDWRALADEGLDAADESEKISERTLSGKRQGARDGKPAGRLQFGFTRIYDERGKLVRKYDEKGNPLDQLPHPTEAPIVAEIVRRIIAGDSLYEISGNLNDRGITKRSGKPWTAQMLRFTIMSPSYIGRRIHRGEDVGPAAWAPLVEPDLWRQAMAILANPNRRTQTRGTRLIHWTAGVALCGRCRGGRLVTMISGPRAGRILRLGCRACNGCHVAMGPFEEFLGGDGGMIVSRLSQPDCLDAFTPTDDPAAQDAEKRIADLQTTLDEHYREAARPGGLSARGLAAVEGEILAQIAQIEKAESARRRLVLPAELRGVDPAEVAGRWPDLPPARKRAYTRAIAEIEVAPATRRGPGFDPWRLAGSRWIGDPLTWGEHWGRGD